MNNNQTSKYLQDMADKLTRVMAGETSDNEAEIVGDILISLANESGFGVDDPRIIKYSFPAMIESANINYARGIVNALDAILALSPLTTAAPKQPGELERLAAQISEVMKNPLLPKHLYSILSDELNSVPDEIDSPEWILSNLKIFCEVKNA